MIEETMTEKQKLTPENEDLFDLIIIGAGPAGMSAAMAAGRGKLKTLLIEKALPGGEISTAFIVDNYLGFPNGILGETLSEKMEHHLKDYDLHHSCESVETIIPQGDINIVKTDLGSTFKAKAIIIAVGLESKKLPEILEKKFLGRGISYYARCDASFYQGKSIAVIGGGNCACYAAEYLSNFAEEIFVVHRSDKVKAVKMLKEKVLSNPKIKFLWNSKLTDAFGIEKIEKIKVENVINGNHTWLDVKAAFVYDGRVPRQGTFGLDIQVDEEGFMITDDCMRTNIKGVYAVGDIRVKQIRQIATAVSDGLIAAINVERDIS